MSQKTRSHLFVAWRYVTHVEALTPQFLRAQGVRALLLDRDNTLVSKEAPRVSSSVARWMQEVKDAGITCVIISNNYHVKDLDGTAAALDLPLVAFACKPLPFALTRTMRELGVSPQETLMVGDHLFTDIAAGNLANVRTVLVQPLSARDLWYAQIFRVFEAPLIKNHPYQDTIE